MSVELASSERVCYVHCNFCNTILAVSVPCNNMFNVVTVRCGHCANLLSVSMASSFQTLPSSQDPQLQRQHLINEDANKDCGSSSSNCNKFSSSFESSEPETPRMPPVRPPEKRQRVPSAYNRFIKRKSKGLRLVIRTSATGKLLVQQQKLGSFPSHSLWIESGWQQPRKIRSAGDCRRLSKV